MGFAQQVMTFHLLAPPNTQTTAEYNLDGFTQATIRFAQMLKSLGHAVFLYGSEENDAPCDELITCITKEDQHRLLMGSQYQYAGADERVELWNHANTNMAREIAKRKQPRDFICTIGGVAQQRVALMHPDLMCIEYSIGYLASFAPYRVYESHAWRHAMQGPEARYFDAVIPLFFDPSAFVYRSKHQKEEFLLYVGRLTARKGIETACAVAELAGFPMKVIGHGDPRLVTHGADYLGVLDERQRNDLLSRAKGLICPTEYIEPFGSVAVEAQLCGTPVICTDFGGFTETVEQRKTGFRCNYLGEFVEAVACLDNLDNDYICRRAVATYSMHTIKYEYQRYFERLMLLWDKGWKTP